MTLAVEWPDGHRIEYDVGAHGPLGTDRFVRRDGKIWRVDEGLYENLAAMAAQDYPHFEILFCAEDPEDPALDVARQVQADFPEVSIRVLSGAVSSR